MLRPCVFTDEISQDLEYALGFAEEHGVRTVELRGVWDKGMTQHTDDDIERIRDLLARRSFSVACIASGFFKCDLPGYPVRSASEEEARATVERHIGTLRRAVELCHVFGAPVVRGFNFWRPARKSAGVPADSRQPNRQFRDADIPPDIWQKMLSEFEEPVRIVESAAVIFGLENEHGCGVGRGDETAKFIQDLGSPGFRVTWDPGNAFFAGDISYPDGYNHIRPYLAHVHVKDALVDPAAGKARWCVVGEGQVDWAGQFRAFVEDGFDGAVSLETHYKPDGGTIEDGTRLCLPAMMKMLREAGWRE